MINNNYKYTGPSTTSSNNKYTSSSARYTSNCTKSDFNVDAQASRNIKKTYGNVG
jgi:hypothetical protein